MIDFRYHLISLMAVFLALGLGILMGSVVLSEKYVERLEGRVSRFEEELEGRREEVGQLNDRIEAFQEFAAESQPRLVEGALAGREVVVFELDGTDEQLVDGLAETIETAGGTVVSTITLTDAFTLDDQPERDQLALLLGSPSDDAAQLREELGSQLGNRAAAAAAERVDAERGGAAAQRLAVFLEDLRDAEFVGVSSLQDGAVPAGAAFVIAGGSAEDPGEGAVPLGLSLASGLTELEAPVVVAEPTTSAWGLAAAVRDDGALGAAVSTADHAETVPGRVATVLALDLTMEGATGHYGTRDGATEVLPPPTPRA
ncbi:MAG: copper transporter [Actinomycetota bacterium]|nr:copper transporter [Actinomycetota bacterium]